MKNKYNLISRMSCAPNNPPASTGTITSGTLTGYNINKAYTGTSCLPTIASGAGLITPVGTAETIYTIGFPKTAFTAASRSNGTNILDITNESVTNQISGLTSSLNFATNAAATSMTTASTVTAGTAFPLSAATLRNNIQKEYCYYYNCYITGIQTLLMQIANSTSTAGGGGVGAATYVTNTDGSVTLTYTPPSLSTDVQQLNSILNQIIQVIQALQTSKTNQLANIYANYEGQVSKLLATQGKLNSQARMLTSNSLIQDVQGSMVDYTIEKNSASTNLLAIYGFMNIVAVGMLYYIYRS